MVITLNTQDLSEKWKWATPTQKAVVVFGSYVAYKMIKRRLGSNDFTFNATKEQLALLDTFGNRIRYSTQLGDFLLIKE